MAYTDEQKRDAKTLFLQGWKVPEIEQQQAIPRRTLYHWIATEQWEALFSGETLIHAAQRRWLCLCHKDPKADDDYREMQFLVNQIEKLTRLDERRQAAAAKAEQGEASSSRGGKAKRKTKNNDFTNVDPATILPKFKAGLFAYQLDLWDHKRERIRNIMKSRQIGLTWYFAREAFADALLTGDNQIFLSASRAQADVFREYIKAFAQDWFGVEIVGRDKIELATPNGTAILYFLSTNSHTAQSYHGHVYTDEYFWIPKFEQLNLVASAMAAHKNWRKTYFSTPSAKSHSAYPFWSGDAFNERNKAAGRPLVKFPSKDTLRKAGQRCPDGQWRRVITVTDAEADGCDLFEIEQLRLEYSEGEFQQLFMCCFIDDTGSVFRLAQLEKCMVDAAKWRDVDYTRAPHYSGPVWIGYDPARHHDGAVVSVLAPPQTIMGKFRVIEKLVLRNATWPQQAAIIQELVNTYRVEYIGIDRTGPGDGVFEAVKAFWPRTTGIYYTPETKTQLVLKAQQIIADDRLQYDVAHSDITAGFMQIKRSVTPGTGKITYTSDRNALTGHADAAWSIMHALINEGLLTPDSTSKAEVVFAA